MRWHSWLLGCRTWTSLEPIFSLPQWVYKQGQKNNDCKVLRNPSRCLITAWTLSLSSRGAAFRKWGAKYKLSIQIDALDSMNVAAIDVGEVNSILKGSPLLSCYTQWITVHAGSCYILDSTPSIVMFFWYSGLARSTIRVLRQHYWEWATNRKPVFTLDYDPPSTCAHTHSYRKGQCFTIVNQ